VDKPSTTSKGPQIFRAARWSRGAVKRVGSPIDLATAISIRKGGGDVVVCGPNVVDNMRLAQQIEWTATSNRFRLENAHLNTAGPGALSHFQPDPRPPDGHTFFEAPPRRMAR
jgi:hypothetical protein